MDCKIEEGTRWEHLRSHDLERWPFYRPSHFCPLALLNQRHYGSRMMTISTTASLQVVDGSYLNTDLIDIAVYYRIHSSEGDGEERAKTSFDERDISSGRINALSITLPHTAGSLKHASQKLKASPCQPEGLRGEVTMAESPSP